MVFDVISDVIRGIPYIKRPVLRHVVQRQQITGSHHLLHNVINPLITWALRALNEILTLVVSKVIWFHLEST